MSGRLPMPFLPGRGASRRPARRRPAGRRRPWRWGLAVVSVSALGLGACADHTVAIRFEPAIGDRYGFRSSVATEVTRTVEGETTTEADRSILDATETVTAIDDDEITLTVQLERDGLPARGYTVRFDRSDRLSAIDLVGGVPIDALGLDVASEIPADVASPPEGELEPGARWTINRTVESADGGTPAVITGTGQIESLGVEDGTDVAVVEVELRVPIRATLDTADGVVTVRGIQTTRSRTTYDLADGAARRDHTEVVGELDVTVAAPSGINAEAVSGSIDYTVVSDTERVGTAD